MTFLSAWRLLLLVLPAVLIAGYVVRLRRNQEAAVRFSSTDLLATLVTRRSGWQRHLPWALLMLSVTVGVMGFAQPAVEAKVPKERATVMLTLDASKSMAADDVEPSRLEAAQAAARSFVSSLPPGLQVGLVTYDHSAQLMQPPTSNRQDMLKAIDSIQLGEGTDTGAGLSLSLDAIENVPPDANGERAPAAIVLMSDGTPTMGSGYASPQDAVSAATQRAASMGVPISTIAYGTGDGMVEVQGETIPVPVDPGALEGIASETGGEAFTADSAAQLDSVYDAIGSAVGYDTETVDITDWFAGAAALLGALAAAGALVWGARLA